jgi:L-amino acid N-acyltransferase YncA
MDIEIHVRAASEADVPAIREIYNYEILNGTATFDTEPKTLEDRLAWFRETQRHPHIVLAAEVDGETVGWGCLQAFRPRPAYRRGKRIGHGHLEAAGRPGTRENGFRSVVAVIAEGHPDSEALHARYGFEYVGWLRKVGYKFERWLDVAHMQLTL